MWLFIISLQKLENYYVRNYCSRSAYFMGAWLGIVIHYWWVNPYSIGGSSCDNFGENHPGPKTIISEMRAGQISRLLIWRARISVFNWIVFNWIEF